MRAGPLADDKVIGLINRCFVPVYAVNEDYHGDGPAPAEERKEYTRIYHEALKAKMSCGSVAVYIVAPTGETIDALVVSKAAETKNLIAMLERTVDQLKTVAGEPLVKPASQAPPPKAGADDLVLHLVSRVDHRYSWGEFPAENWIVLKKEVWAKLLPEGEAVVGSRWEIDRQASARLLTHFYPQTENNDVATNRIDQQTLKAKVIGVKDGVARARLDGTLKMKHPFYPKRDDNNFVEATLVGYVDFDSTAKQIKALRLVTDQAKYDRFTFQTALREVK